MDIFTNINWFPSLNDVVDDEFVDTERLERESIMYRTLKDTLTDPFDNIDDDYLNKVTDDDIKDAIEEMRKPKGGKNKKKKPLKACVVEEKKPAQARVYIPGKYKAKNIIFPKSSVLNTEQHAFCLKVFAKISQNQKLDVDVQTAYYSLQEMIKKENAEFLALARSNWNPSDIKIVNEELINRQWKLRAESIKKLHRYYVETGTIPFTSQKEIKLQFNKTALQMEQNGSFTLPNLIRRFTISTETIEWRENDYFSKSPQSTLISEDVNCQKIIESNEVNLVISTSGLKCLVNNLDPAHKNTWTLPVQVKKINEKNVIFIDKVLPPTSSNVLQKNAWLYKHILKLHFIYSGLYSGSKNCLYVDPDKPGKDDSNNLSKNVENKKKNYCYNIFTIGACGSSQNELMKNKVEKDYKILVRTKADGIETDGNRVQRILIAPKLEYQVGLGAEAVSLEEASKQWASLTFRPDAKLVRVRMESGDSQIIQYEWRNITKINNELRRLYSVKSESSLQIIYNVISEMMKMSPGKYLLRHTVRNGAFMSVFKEAPAPGKNTFDVQSLYVDEEYPTVPNPPWPVIDTCLTTPALINIQRMPGMFYPSKFTPKIVQTTTRKRGRPVGSKTKKSQNKQPKNTMKKTN